MVHVVKVDEMKRERKTQSVEEENRVLWEIVATGEYSCRSEVVWTWQLPNNKWTRKEKQWKERGNEGILLVGPPKTTRLTKKTHSRGLFFFLFGYTHLVLVFLFLFLWFVFPCIFHLVFFFFPFFFFHSIILIWFGSFGLYFFKYFINCKTHP